VSTRPLPDLAVSDVLLVCTANLCRSPIAEALLRHRFEERGLSVAVASAGLREPDRPVLADALEVLAGRGLDARDHRSRRIDPDLVRSAGLILGLERKHVREAVVLDPHAWPRAFTLKEVVRRGQAVGARRPDESWPRWLARVHAGRRRGDLLGSSPEDDVADPTGGTLEDYEATAAELDELLTRLVRLGWPPGVA
jgi:protein-tyrosine phosphatase